MVGDHGMGEPQGTYLNINAIYY